MSTTAAASTNSIATRKRRISLDTWAVLLAIGLAILVRAGLLHRVPW